MMGLQEGSVPVAAELFLETGEFVHMTIMFIHETCLVKWICLSFIDIYRGQCVCQWVCFWT